MEIIEALFVEILVDGIRHGVADAQHGTEGIGSRTQVGDFAQELQRVPLLLEGIGFGVGRAVHLDLRGLHLDPLPRPERLHEPSSTRMQAPVVMGLSSSSPNFERSTTTCMFATHDPSFRAMNATFLFPRLVRTHPLTTMSVSTTPDFRISTILCVFI